MIDEAVKLPSIDLSWIALLNDLYWEGRIQIWLSKGYITLKVTDKEKKHWKLSEHHISKIQEVLQTSVDKIQADSLSIKKQILELLSNCEEVKIPNFNLNEDFPVYNQLTDITPEIETNIEQELNPILPLICQSDYEALENVYMNWKRRNSWPSLKKGAELASKVLDTKNLKFSPLDYERYQKIPKVLPPFLLLLQYFADPIPDGSKIKLYRQLLLLKAEEITRSLDFIIFSSWKQYPKEMYALTREWIASRDPYLIDWLIHGIEVPGRKESVKALRFLKPILQVENENVEWIFKHVLAQIIAASPYESFTHLETWLNDPQISIRTQRILEQALREIIEDKIHDNNLMKEDFPNLDETLHSILTNWSKEGSQVQYQLSQEILNQLR